MADEVTFVLFSRDLCVLVDGFIAGAWRIRREKRTRLFDFLASDADERDLRIVAADWAGAAAAPAG